MLRGSNPSSGQWLTPLMPTKSVNKGGISLKMADFPTQYEIRKVTNEVFRAHSLQIQS